MIAREINANHKYPYPRLENSTRPQQQADAIYAKSCPTVR